MAADRLRPQAEGAAALAPAAGVEADIGVTEVTAEIILDLQVALIDRRDHGQHVHVLDDRAILVADERSIWRAPGDAIDLLKRLALRDLQDREVIFLARDEIDVAAGGEALVRLDRDLRADEPDDRLRVARLDQRGGADVLPEARGRGVEDDQLLAVDLVRDVVPALVVRGGRRSGATLPPSPRAARARSDTRRTSPRASSGSVPPRRRHSRRTREPAGTGYASWGILRVGDDRAAWGHSKACAAPINRSHEEAGQEHGERQDVAGGQQP